MAVSPTSELGPALCMASFSFAHPQASPGNKCHSWHGYNIRTVSLVPLTIWNKVRHTMIEITLHYGCYRYGSSDLGYDHVCCNSNLLSCTVFELNLLLQSNFKLNIKTILRNLQTKRTHSESQGIESVHEPERTCELMYQWYICWYFCNEYIIFNG